MTQYPGVWPDLLFYTPNQANTDAAAAATVTVTVTADPVLRTAHTTTTSVTLTPEASPRGVATLRSNATTPNTARVDADPVGIFDSQHTAPVQIRAAATTRIRTLKRETANTATNTVPYGDPALLLRRTATISVTVAVGTSVRLRPVQRAVVNTPVTATVNVLDRFLTRAHTTAGTTITTTATATGATVTRVHATAATALTLTATADPRAIPRVTVLRVTPAATPRLRVKQRVTAATLIADTISPEALGIVVGDIDPLSTALTLEVDAHPRFEAPICPPPGGLIDDTGNWIHPPTVCPPDDDPDADPTVHPAPPVVRALETRHITMPDDPGMLDGLSRPDSSTYLPNVTHGTAGWLRVVINRKDRTWYRGVPLTVVDLETQEPYGSSIATLELPQLTAFTKTPRWLRVGADVEIELINVNGQRTRTLFEGFIDTIEQRGGENEELVTSVACVGALRQADLILAQPELIWDQEDLGRLIPRLLNTIPGRRYKRVKRVETGIHTRGRSNYETRLERVTDLLSTAYTQAGDKYTVACDPGRRPKLQKVDRTTIHHTIYYGAPGVNVNVTKDSDAGVTTLYGRGVDKKMRSWGNLRTPGFAPNLKKLTDAGNTNVLGLEPYPYHLASRSLTPGTTDAGTDTGNGVTVLQRRLKDVGVYRGSVTGTYNSDTVAAVKKWQRRKGAQVDGICGGQTWSTLFYLGRPGGVLKDAYYAPLAGQSKVEPHLYSSDGTITGANPNFNPDALRRERFRVYADGHTLSEALDIADKELKRDKKMGWAGTISLTTDPETTSRYEILAGDNVLIKNIHGGNLLVHVARATLSSDGALDLEVDSEARDIYTVDAIKERERESRNPSRRRAKVRRAELEPSRPVIDKEFIGQLNAVTHGGLWSIAKIAVGTEGRIVKTKFTAHQDRNEDSSGTPFVVALFDSDIKARDLVAKVGDPFTQIDDGVNPFPGDEATAAWLTGNGLIDVLGGPDARLGYYPGSEDQGSPITGVHRDESITLSFTSSQPPHLWVAVYSRDSAHIKGELFTAPDGG